MAIENTLPSPVVPQRIIHFLQNMTRVCIFDQNSVLLYLRNAHVQLHLHFWTAIQHWFKYVHLNWSSQCLQTALSNAHHFSHVKDAFTRKSSSLVTMDNPCTLHPYFKTLSCVSTPRFQRVEDQQMAALQRRRRRPLPPPQSMVMPEAILRHKCHNWMAVITNTDRFSMQKPTSQCLITRQSWHN